MRKFIKWLHLIFCKHKNRKRMLLRNYDKETSHPDKYILTYCEDCSKILHGYWMERSNKYAP